MGKTVGTLRQAVDARGDFGALGAIGFRKGCENNTIQYHLILLQAYRSIDFALESIGTLPQIGGPRASRPMTD